VLRKPILGIDRTSLGVDVAAVLQEATALDDTIDIPAGVGLVDIFPDLAVFGPPAVPTEGKFEKRLDEAGAGGRMAHVSRLFDLRPVMLTALSPSRNRAPDGRWADAVGPMYDVEEDLNDSSFDDMQNSMGESNVATCSAC
jgi:chromatin modification-related protein VID21